MRNRETKNYKYIIEIGQNARKFRFFLFMFCLVKRKLKEGGTKRMNTYKNAYDFF